MNTLVKSNIHILRYAGLVSVNVTILLCIAINSLTF